MDGAVEPGADAGESVVGVGSHAGPDHGEGADSGDAGVAHVLEEAVVGHVGAFWRSDSNATGEGTGCELAFVASRVKNVVVFAVGVGGVYPKHGGFVC